VKQKLERKDGTKGVHTLVFLATGPMTYTFHIMDI